MTAQWWLSKWRHLSSMNQDPIVLTASGHMSVTWRLSSHVWRERQAAPLLSHLVFLIFYTTHMHWCRAVSWFFVLMNKFCLRCAQLGLGLFVIGAMLYRVCAKRANVNHKRSASLHRIATALKRLNNICFKLFVKIPPNEEHVVHFSLISPSSVYGNKWVTNNEASTRKHLMVQVKQHFAAIFGWETIKKNLDLWY